MPTPRFSGGSPVTSSSPKKILPSVGFSRPQIRFRAVLLPQPEGPKSPISLPSGISKSKSFTAMTSSRFFLPRTGPRAGNFLVRCCNTIFMCIFPFLIYMIQGSKGLSPHELAHRWAKKLGTRPDMSIKVGCQSHDMRILGRIVRARSAEQSVGSMIIKSHRSPSNHWIYDPGRDIRSFRRCRIPAGFL